MNHKYHYFYKIENTINGDYYYGIHSTDRMDDGYMGSGRRLKRAFKMFGKENFKKTILKFFKTRELASIYENEVVSECCVKDISCYNLRERYTCWLTQLDYFNENLYISVYEGMHYETEKV